MNIISLDWRYRNYLDLMSQLCGSDILAYDYCGYGFSTGRPSEENCYESIEARGGPGGGKDGGIIELDIWPVTWGYTQIYIYIYIIIYIYLYNYIYIYIYVYIYIYIYMYIYNS